MMNEILNKLDEKSKNVLRVFASMHREIAREKMNEIAERAINKVMKRKQKEISNVTIKKDN